MAKLGPTCSTTTLFPPFRSRIVLDFSEWSGPAQLLIPRPLKTRTFLPIFGSVFYFEPEEVQLDARKVSV